MDINQTSIPINRKSKIKSLKKRLKKALYTMKEWALIDILTLIGGAIIISSYIEYCESHPNAGSALLNLWPNIATEILGVWVSVRIIGSLLNSREARRNSRYNLVGNPNFLCDIVERLVPKFYDHDLISLKRELGYFHETWTRRLKHFHRDERQDILHVIQTAEAFLKNANSYVLTARVIDSLFDVAMSYHFDGAFDDLRSEFQKLRDGKDHALDDSIVGARKLLETENSKSKARDLIKDSLLREILDEFSKLIKLESDLFTLSDKIEDNARKAKENILEEL